MQLVNILLTIGLIALISSITVLSLCAVIASSRNEQSTTHGKNSNFKERRKNATCSFPLTCSDGTMVYFDRRLQSNRYFA